MDVSQPRGVLIQGMREVWPGLGDDIYADFTIKNESPADLEPLFASEVECVVADLEAMSNASSPTHRELRIPRLTCREGTDTVCR
jgi:hypothetical protein